MLKIPIGISTKVCLSSENG